MKSHLHRHSTIKGIDQSKFDSIDDIMMILSINNVRAMKKDFMAQSNKALDMMAFVSAMRGCLKKYIVNEMKFVLKCIELFRQIDVNGDQVVEWDEFTSFIVELGMAQSDDQRRLLDQAYEIENKRHYVPKGILESHVLNCQVVEYAKGISKMAYLEESSDLIRFFDVPKSESVERLILTKWVRHDTAYHPHKVFDFQSDHDGLLTSSAEYDEHRGPFYLSYFSISADLQFELEQRVETKSPQTSICWETRSGFLFTACGLSRNTGIQKWRRTAHNLVRIGTLKGHSGCVTQLLLLNLNAETVLLSGADDGDLRLWNTQNNTCLKVISAHDSGVLKMVSCDPYDVVVTIGNGRISTISSFELLVWDVEKLLEKPKPRRMIGHSCPLVSITACNSAEPPHVASIDVEHIIRIWNPQTLQCVQILTDVVSPIISPIRDLTAIPATENKPCQLVLAGRGYQLLPFVTEENPPTSVKQVLYNPVFLQFITVSSEYVVIWDAVSGKRLHSFHCETLFQDHDAEFPEPEIGGAPLGTARTVDSLVSTASSVRCHFSRDFTYACLDNRNRKLIIGNERGEIGVFNCLNGAIMKRLDPHLGVVTGIRSCGATDVILSCGWDGSLKFLDDRDIYGFNAVTQKSVILRQIRVFGVNGNKQKLLDNCNNPELTQIEGAVKQTADITCITHSSHLNLVAVGVRLIPNKKSPRPGVDKPTLSHLIQLWDFRVCRFVGVCIHAEDLPETAVEITSLVFLDPLPVLMSGDIAGNICLWAVDPSPLANRCVFRWNVRDLHLPGILNASIGDKPLSNAGGSRFPSPKATSRSTPTSVSVTCETETGTETETHLENASSFFPTAVQELASERKEETTDAIVDPNDDNDNDDGMLIKNLKATSISILSLAFSPAATLDCGYAKRNWTRRVGKKNTGNVPCCSNNITRSGVVIFIGDSLGIVSRIHVPLKTFTASGIHPVQSGGSEFTRRIFAVPAACTLYDVELAVEHEKKRLLNGRRHSVLSFLARPLVIDSSSLVSPSARSEDEDTTTDEDWTDTSDEEETTAVCVSDNPPPSKKRRRRSSAHRGSRVRASNFPNNNNSNTTDSSLSDKIHIKNVKQPPQAKAHSYSGLVRRMSSAANLPVKAIKQMEQAMRNSYSKQTESQNEDSSSTSEAEEETNTLDPVFEADGDDVDPSTFRDERSLSNAGMNSIGSRHSIGGGRTRDNSLSNPPDVIRHRLSRNAKSDIYGTSSGSGDTKELPVVQAQWKAHETGINDIQYIPEISAVATAGGDGHARIFECSGDIMGEMDPSSDRCSSRPWYFPVNTRSRQIQKEREARKLIADISIIEGRQKWRDHVQALEDTRRERELGKAQASPAARTMRFSRSVGGLKDEPRKGNVLRVLSVLNAEIKPSVSHEASYDLSAQSSVASTMRRRGKGKNTLVRALMEEPDSPLTPASTFSLMSASSTKRAAINSVAIDSQDIDDPHSDWLRTDALVLKQKKQNPRPPLPPTMRSRSFTPKSGIPALLKKQKSYKSQKRLMSRTWNNNGSRSSDSDNESIPISRSQCLNRLEELEETTRMSSLGLSRTRSTGKLQKMGFTISSHNSSLNVSQSHGTLPSFQVLDGPGMADVLSQTRHYSAKLRVPTGQRLKPISNSSITTAGVPERDRPRAWDSPKQIVNGRRHRAPPQKGSIRPSWEVLKQHRQIVKSASLSKMGKCLLPTT